jgi:hypothetical protein
MRMNKLKVKYDKQLKIFMASPTIWTATGATQWFDNYRIISSMSGPLDTRLKVINISDYLPVDATVPTTTGQIMTSPGWKEAVARSSLDDYQQILNRPTSQPAREDLLGNDLELASRFENKVWFRQTFGHKLQFPESRLVRVDDMYQKDWHRFLQELNAEALVVQHPTLAGGRGTYHVRNQVEFDQSIASLRQITALSDIVVVSKRLDAPLERTIQACVTSDDIFVGPAQAQLVGNPYLTSSHQGDIQFCGGRIADGLLSSELYKKATSAVRLVGKELQKEGYRGIFGMDFLVSEDKLYVLEVNPRMTGLTPLLAFLQEEMPFLLLHILELARSPYEVTQRQSPLLPGAGSFIVVYAQKDCTVDFETGVYTMQAQRQGDGFEEGKIFPENEDDFFVGMRVPKGHKAQRGKSLAFIYARTQLFDDYGKLDQRVLPLVDKIRNRN